MLGVHISCAKHRLVFIQRLARWNDLTQTNLELIMQGVFILINTVGNTPQSFEQVQT